MDFREHVTPIGLVQLEQTEPEPELTNFELG